MSEVKRLYKVRNGKVLGVCGGIAEYLGLDPTVLRLIWAVGTLFSCGIGIVAYLLCALVLPYKGEATTPPAE